MTVFLGCAGKIELTRSSIDKAYISEVQPADVNARHSRFSFDYPPGMLITGDQVEIKATDGGVLSFIGGWVYPDGKWFIHVDQVGSITLYESFSDSIAGEGRGRVGLKAPDRVIPISVAVHNSFERLVGQVSSYELNTSRDAVDVSELGEEFHRQHATLISGSGSLTCFFDYLHARCEGVVSSNGYEPELAVYLHQLLVRQEMGSGFHAKCYVVSRGEGQDVDDEVWYEFDGLITNAALAFEPGQPVRSTIQFVSTGEIRLLVKTVGNLLLQENTDRIRLEKSQGAGFVELEQADE